jgi:hypothetical protein
MRTRRVIETRVRDHQIVEDLTAEDGFGNDPGYVLDRDVAIPDSLGINHDGRPMLALFEAAGMVGADQRAESGLFQLLLERLAQRLLPFGIAAAARVARRTDIAADENVMGERRHGEFARDLQSQIRNIKFEILNIK